MSLSRRQFFRGLVGQKEDHQREAQRRAAVEAYVRTNLLPYDFALTAEQTVEVLAAVVAQADIEGDEDLLTWERCGRMREIADEKVEGWREEFLKAEEARRLAPIYVAEFFAMEATPDDLRRLGERFRLPGPEALEKEIEREIRYWLSGLQNARLAAFADTDIRALIFSEIRSWC
jgi:hypothetical protein